MKKILILILQLIFTQAIYAQLTEAEAKAKTENDENVYNTSVVEFVPEFPGGISEFYNYIGKNYRIPNVKGLGGKVFVKFVIEKDGRVDDIEVIRDIGHGTGNEAIRVLKECPKWTPGIQNGKNVRVLYSLPINISEVR
jgi:protein TonB